VRLSRTDEPELNSHPLAWSGPPDVDRAIERRAGMATELDHALMILAALARSAGETVAREELANAVFSRQATAPRYDPGVDRSLDVHVSHLRHTHGDDAREPKGIRTVRALAMSSSSPCNGV
jgi:DNA-binding response OmpR family regulator